MRKRALRRLAREEYDAYRGHYNGLTAGGYDKHQARGRAWTMLRQQFPDAYLGLYALEQVSPGYEASPEVRSKSWGRATALLRELREAPYREHVDKLLARGLARPDATGRALVAIRSEDPELFARLLADEIRLCQFLSGEAGGQPPGPGEYAAIAAGRACFYAAVDALKRAADVSAAGPGRDPAALYGSLAERVAELTASVEAERVPRA
jgi:hypothetical protein